MARYEFDDGKSSKFWEIQLDGDSFTVRYGRLGTDGQTSTKVYADAEAAQKEADKLIQSKTKKGYVEVASAATPLPAANRPQEGNPELEAAIFARPDDLEAWDVYGAWLRSQGDVRGELVALEITKAQGAPQADLQEEIDAGIAEHRAAWLGPQLMKTLESQDEDEQVLQLEWRFGFLHKVKARTVYDWEGATVEQLLKAILKSSASRFLQDISVGMTDAEGETSFQREILALSKAGKRPSVRRVYVGDFEFPDETEISWTEVGSVEKLYAVFPNLEWLKVQGGGIELGKLAHDRLETLVIHTGGLPSGAARSIAQAALPNLTTLEVWFGADEYGGDSNPDMLAPLLSGEGVPKLEHLGLMNAEFTNDLPARLAGTRLLARLKTLDLSMGTMTEPGAEALLEHAAAFKHLNTLNVTDNILSEGALTRLRECFGRALVGGAQKDDDEDWRYVSVGE